MSATIEKSVDLVDNYLMHFGVPGQKKGQHDPNRRWQSHAVYAQGMPNPDAKVRGEREGAGNEWYKDGFVRKQIGKASGARMNDTAMLERKIREKSTEELKRATERLKAENKLKEEIITMNKLNKQYEEALHADEGKAIKSFRNALSWMARSTPAKIAVNTMYYTAYDAMKQKYGPEKAGAMFNGIVKTGGGGGNQQQQKNNNSNNNGNRR